MKNIIFSAAILCLAIAISSCEKDNMAGPDAKIFGSVRDSVDGSLVEQDMINGSKITAYEHGYETPTAQTWDFKVSGEYRNNLVFSNTYDLKLQFGNFFPLLLPDVVIEPGDNLFDIVVVPYLRIKDAQIIYDQAANKIIATFRIEGGSPAVKLKKISLYAFSDMYVGDPFKFTNTGGGDLKTFNPTILPDPSTIHTLSIDLSVNEKNMKTGRSYFFRIGAQADNSNLGSVKYNYAPAVKIGI